MKALLGAHLSIAGGLYKACIRAAELKATALQIFVHNQRRWALPSITNAAAREFRAAVKDAGLRVVSVHGSYLINLATGKRLIHKMSKGLLRAELAAVRKIGAQFLTVHPGSHTDTDFHTGMDRIAQTCGEVIDSLENPPMLLLEMTAGAGKGLGSTFEQMAQLLHTINRPEHVGVCLDTCHIFAAGYDIRTERAYARTMKVLDDTIGAKSVRLIHANDSRYDLGKNHDRHWHIGKGKIGSKGFELLINDKRFADCACILETPKHDDNQRAMDPVNLKKLRGLIK